MPEQNNNIRYNERCGDRCYFCPLGEESKRGLIFSSGEYHCMLRKDDCSMVTAHNKNFRVLYPKTDG